MKGGWRYRIVGLFGTIGLVAGAVFVANQPPIRALIALVPVLGDLPMATASGTELLFEATTTAVVVTLAVFPLFKPRPRRILDIWMSAIRRSAIGLLALATVGYFDYTYRLPRATLIVTGAFLLVALPAFFVAIRQRPRLNGDRTLIIGDNPQSMADILDTVGGNVIGYVSPPSPYDPESGLDEVALGVADGGEAVARLDELPCLGGLSRLDEVFVDHDVDTAVLAFAHPDRAEFFGAIDSCYEHGVAAKVHRDHADAVLTNDVAAGELVDMDLEPWDVQDHVLKRLLDVVFSLGGLIALSPVLLAIAAAVKLEDGGPIFYGQERTAAFGDTFTVYKFRSMVPGAELKTGVKLSEEDDGGVDPRVTRVGRVLRQTHLDEIPQLWSILRGHMSVVGPRPERPHLDEDMKLDAAAWRSRWFVKPGLTGLAQIHGATGFDPEEKLRYDVEYIRKQSFWFDLKIVVRQVWLVLVDLVATVRK